jgi:hypothetical protein
MALLPGGATKQWLGLVLNVCYWHKADMLNALTNVRFWRQSHIDQQLVTNLDFEYTAGGVRVASGFPKWDPKPGASTAGTLAALTLAISHACRVY